MAYTTANLYAAHYADLTTLSVTAATMKGALALLAVLKQQEPMSIKVTATGLAVTTDLGDTTKLTATITAVEGASVYPAELDEVTIGDTVYFTAVVPDKFTVTNWFVDGVAQDVTDKVFKYLVTAGTEHKIECKLEQVELPPEPITNLVITPTAEGMTATWTNPTDNFQSVFVTIQDAVTLEFLHQHFVTAETFTVDDLQDEHSYIFAAQVLGANGKYSELVTEEFDTTALPTVFPPVTDVSAVSESAGELVATWTNPDATGFDHIEITLMNVTEGTSEIVEAAQMQTYTFDSLTTGTYKVSIVAAYDGGHESEAVLSEEVEVA